MLKMEDEAGRVGWGEVLGALLMFLAYPQLAFLHTRLVPDAKRAELEAVYLNMTSPFRTAEKFGILDIIDPRETRGILCDWVEDAWALVSARRASAA